MYEVNNKHRCLMCGKEWTVLEPAIQRHFLCRDCTGRWLSGYLWRLKVRVTQWVRGIMG